MENNATGAPSDAALFHQMPATEQPQSPSHDWRTFSDPTYPFLDTFDDLPSFDTKLFDFEILNSSMPPPPPPTAPLVVVDSETSEKPNEQSGAAPEGPTDGLDRGESVVSVDLCMAAGGADGGGDTDCGEKKAKPRRQNITLNAKLTALMQAGPAVSLAKKAMDPEELAELARVDPKKAKRILANRESAAKSKERKKRYEMELQKKVELLDYQVTNLTNCITMFEREFPGRAVHVKDIRIKVEAMREEDQIKDALSSVLKEEVHDLDDENKNLDVLLTYRSPGGFSSPFSMLALHQFRNPPSQQHLNPEQAQFSMPNPLCPCGASFTGHYGPNFSNFNQQN